MREEEHCVSVLCFRPGGKRPLPSGTIEQELVSSENKRKIVKRGRGSSSGGLPSRKREGFRPEGVICFLGKGIPSGCWPLPEERERGAMSEEKLLYVLWKFNIRKRGVGSVPYHSGKSHSHGGATNLLLL